MTNTAPQNWMERTGATPGKLALIGVLALVLAYVVISQLPGRKPAKPMAAEPAAVNTPPTISKRAGGGEAPAADVRAVTAWPHTDIELVVAYDPFATPKWANPAPATAAHNLAAGSGVAQQATEDTLAQLRQTGAAVIVEIDGEALALVGDRQLRVGDTLAGFRVQQITKSGIVLAEEGHSP